MCATSAETVLVYWIPGTVTITGWEVWKGTTLDPIAQG